MSFGGDLDKFAKKAIDRNFTELKQNVGIALFSAVIKGSPVGDPDLWESPAPEGYVGGRFRANWNCNIDTIDRTTTDNVDPSGSVAISLVVSKCEDAGAAETLFLTNSLPYAVPLEYEAHSSQAPYGMVRLNVARFRKILKKELAKYQ